MYVKEMEKQQNFLCNFVEHQAGTLLIIGHQRN